MRRISRTMFVRAAEMVRRPGLFRAENDADACRSFAAVEWHYSDRLLAEDNGLWLREGDSAHRFNGSPWHATKGTHARRVRLCSVPRIGCERRARCTGKPPHTGWAGPGVKQRRAHVARHHHPKGRVDPSGALPDAEHDTHMAGLQLIIEVSEDCADHARSCRP